MSTKTDTKRERPLSPHLQVYKPQMTSILSILHRATGVALVIGLLGFVWMLVAAANGASTYNVFLDFATSKLGIFIQLGLSFSVFYHALNGLRHLVWDTGRMFNIEHAKTAGYIVFYGAIVLTVIFWKGLLG